MPAITGAPAHTMRMLTRLLLAKLRPGTPTRYAMTPDNPTSLPNSSLRMAKLTKKNTPVNDTWTEAPSSYSSSHLRRASCEAFALGKFR